ncbi:MAG: carotenoid 1,2-hydratase [Pseudomonadota bacterium]
MIGTVFSPYYAFSGRKDPHNYVSLNVGLYGKGVRRWTMTERGNAALTQSPQALQIGPSDLKWASNTLTITIKERGAPLPQRVEGQIVIACPNISAAAYKLDTKGRHFWHPIAPHARADASFDAPAMQWSGDAYVDSNWGSEPLEDGFEYWDWARAPLPDGAGIYYDARTRTGEDRRLALRFNEAGQAREFPCPAPTPLKKGPIWRVRRAVPLENGGSARTVTMLEDTPFYTRSRIEVPFEGQSAVAVHESLDLDRFASTWVRCLLPFRMPRRTSWP